MGGEIGRGGVDKCKRKGHTTKRKGENEGKGERRSERKGRETESKG